MELILASHSSYPRIGESGDFQSLRRTIARWEKGEATGSDLRAAEDHMTELALSEQIEAGLDVVTDGQIHWYDPISHLAGKLEGVRINGLLRFFDTNFYFRQPVVESRIKRTTPLIVEEFLFAKGKSARPVKPVLTGPYTLAQLSIEEEGKAEGFEGMLWGYTEALGEEVAALAAAGAMLIQVDEPALLKYPADFRHAEKSITHLAARKGSAELALALFFGDPAPLYDGLQTLPVDILNLDFTYGPRLADVVADAGSSKTLALGLVDGRNTRLEDPVWVTRQLEQIGSNLSSERAYLNPSCGLEYLPRDRAQLKLKHLATIRETFLGSQA
ncbi:MAG: hypothetical protein HYS33_02995 [Acidobacteria bacterium]|nr:hypothetical protein [Acidobacteriota bacterium]